jgi:hypothetical protein
MEVSEQIQSISCDCNLTVESCLGVGEEEETLLQIHILPLQSSHITVKHPLGVSEGSAFFVLLVGLLGEQFSSPAPCLDGDPDCKVEVWVVGVPALLIESVQFLWR